jgi:hypothetical protein
VVHLKDDKSAEMNPPSSTSMISQQTTRKRKMNTQTKQPSQSVKETRVSKQLEKWIEGKHSQEKQSDIKKCLLHKLRTNQGKEKRANIERKIELGARVPKDDLDYINKFKKLAE